MKESYEMIEKKIRESGYPRPISFLSHFNIVIMSRNC